jgi:hypothetical protein
MGRVYALESTDGLALIDAGLGLAANKVLRQLQVSGRSPSDVKRILITHIPITSAGWPSCRQRRARKSSCIHWTGRS